VTIEVPGPADMIAGGEPRGGPMGLRPSREAIDGGELPAGRNAALTALFAAHYRRLVGLARLLVDDQAGAEDVVQDAFLALSRRWGKLRDPVSAHAYLQRSVVNGARSRLRRSYVRQRLHLVPSPDEPSAESAVLDRTQVSHMRAIIGELSGRQREVLVLRYYLDLSEAEIAGLLGVSAGSVKQHASRAINRLAARLEAAP
jgi:RNA polymerase sigma-70 factor (sigma-E family)